MLTLIDPYDEKYLLIKPFLTETFLDNKCSDKALCLILKNMLDSDPSERPSFLEILEVVEEPPNLHPMELTGNLSPTK